MNKNLKTWMIVSIAILYILDQVSKWLIVLNYSPPIGNYVTDFTRVFNWEGIMSFNILRIHNTGVAFGFGNGTAWAPILFLIIQFLALIGLFVLLKRGFFNTRLLKIAWVGIMTGVIGNMTDRLLQGFFLPGAEKLSFLSNLGNGYVVDFLDFSFPWIKTEMYPYGYHWPSFNVADSCICIAAGLFLISSFFFPPPEPQKSASKVKKEDKSDDKKEAQ